MLLTYTLFDQKFQHLNEKYDVLRGNAVVLLRRTEYFAVKLMGFLAKYGICEQCLIKIRPVRICFSSRDVLLPPSPKVVTLDERMPSSLTLLTMRPIRHHRQPAWVPFALLVLFIGGLVAFAYGLDKYVFQSEGAHRPIDFVKSDTAEIKIRLSGSESFKRYVSNSFENLLEGEAILVDRGPGVILTYPDGSTLSLDEDAQVEIVTSRVMDSGDGIFVSRIDAGQVWAEVESNAQTTFTLAQGNITITTDGASFNLSNQAIAVFAGEVYVTSAGGSVTVEVGQQLDFNATTLAQLQGRETVSKSIISSELEESDWYFLNTQNASADLQLPSLLGDGTENAATQESTETEPQPEIVILSPGANDDVIKTDDDPLKISGRIPTGTSKVSVNDYVLRKFVEGQTSFSYNVSKAWGNLTKGENVYVVQAFDENEQMIAKAHITIINGLGEGARTDDDSKENDENTEPEHSSQEATDIDAKNNAKENSEDKAKTNERAATGILSITSPEKGSIQESPVITIRGTAPSNAARIDVDDYTLTQFSIGDTQWVYRLSDAYDNRPVGEQTVDVVAYDTDGDLIDTASVTFTIEELPEPEISPSSESSSTTDSASPYAAEIREGTLPPVEQSLTEPTI